MSPTRVSAATTALIAALVAQGCSDAGTGPASSDPPAAIAAEFADVVAVPGSLRSIRARVTDTQGDGVPDVEVTFTASSGHGDVGSGASAVVTTDQHGVASADWLLPFVTGQFTVEARASHGGAALAGSPVTFNGVVESFSPTVDEMLNTVEQQIRSLLAASRQSLSANPLLFARIQLKIDMLGAPNLASAIVASRRFESTTVTSLDARTLDLVSVFPLDSLRARSQEAATTLSAALPVLEAFMDLPIPAPNLRVWYGFALGSSGGGGNMLMEDAGSYQARAHLISAPPPYEAFLTHELAHSYLGHESLTQFLEVLLYNVVTNGSTDVAQWTHKRDYTGPSAANTGVRALLEIREMIGHDAMARAYRAIYPLRPPYGGLLTAEMKQTFVDQAPAGLEAQVAAKVEQIGY